MQELEIVTKSETEIEAISILEAEGIKKDEIITVRVTLGGHIVKIKKVKSLTTIEYVNFRKNSSIAIHKDSDSEIRAVKIFNATRDVEVKLRELFLYIAPFIDSPFSIPVIKKGKASNYDSATKADQLDPLTSQYTFEGIIDVLGFDLQSLDAEIGYTSLSELAESSADFDDFKQILRSKSQPRLIWSLLEDGILLNNIEWKNISPQLRQVIEYRNNASHHKVITPSYLKKALNNCDGVSECLKITPGLITKNVIEYTEMWQRVIDDSTSQITKIAEMLSQDSLARMHTAMAPLQTKILDMSKVAEAIQSTLPAINFASLVPRLPYHNMINTENLLAAMDTITPRLIEAQNSARIFERIVKTESNTPKTPTKKNKEPKPEPDIKPKD